MRKLFVYLCIITLFVGFSSCKTSKTATSSETDLNGEWKVVEVGGTDISDRTGNGNDAYIGFDVSGKRMYGSPGCNRMFGQLTIDESKGIISFGTVGTTKMMCANMEVERMVIDAVNNVGAYEIQKDGMLILKDGKGKALMKLKKK
ncbi:MAG: META domain-containing protein [Prevotella sp.]|nr:META domain-containing protein [Prevotella sp.]